MKQEEVVRVLDEVIRSLRENPGQFNIKVDIDTAGAVGIGGSGRHAIVGIANGGGVGFSATASAPSEMSLSIARGETESRLGSWVPNVVVGVVAQLIADSIAGV